MANSPSNYIPDLPRVSAICEFVYPFIGESKDRFHSWLSRNNISLEEYMKEASEWWTYVHKAMEDLWNWKKLRCRKYKDIVQSGIDFHNDFSPTNNKSEVYVKCKEYQWTLDRLCTITKEWWILDWKSYGLAKAKFGLTNTYKKPYDKLKKARLQLSLYNRALGYKYKLAVVELTPDGYYFHVLEQLPKEELEHLLLLYKNSFIDQL